MGLTFAFLEVNITLAAVVIAVTAFIISIIGFGFGKKDGKIIGKRAEFLGGIILIVIGLKILSDHLL